MIATEVMQSYATLNDAQHEAIGHADGPLLVIAGPGAGKTLTLVLRTLNLLMTGKAQPKEVVVCTFTEKAAYELRDRIAAAALKVGYVDDLSELRVGTIHGLCQRLLVAWRYRTPLGAGFEILDELTQKLFVNDNFDEVIGAKTNERFLGHWQRKWDAIEGFCRYADKIAEELIDPSKLTSCPDPFLNEIGRAYLAYHDALIRGNRVDFAHLQRLTWDLLQQPEARDAIVRSIRYVMVDEYQDTNFVQDQILSVLAGAGPNLAVVGDEDQSLYRFRGATVRNILEFPTRFPGCTQVQLTTNYRSHKAIIAAYDRWMSSADWSNAKGPAFRFRKQIAADRTAPHPDYPAVFRIWGESERDEADRLADSVKFLRDNGIIQDYSQVAVLLRSVRTAHSGAILNALDRRGIPAFCPRARAFFENDEVRFMVAALALVFGWYGDGRDKVIAGGSVDDLGRFIDDAMGDLAGRYASAELIAALKRAAAAIDALGPSEALDQRPADVFYALLAVEPFAGWLADEGRARNLAVLSNLLYTFQAYYHFGVITGRNKQALKRQLFASFFRLLLESGLNDYEDPDRPFPKGHVQVMTIHQAKGLEFPVVIVGSLSTRITTSKKLDQDLGPFYQRPTFEPVDRITGFDRMRLHYVAFSRAEKVLVLTTHAQPNDYFSSLWEGLPQWPYVEKDILAAQRFSLRQRIPVKRTYSFTGDLRVYETCPRQYEFFRFHDFTPSRSAVIFFGLLVHQTIEEIHRRALDGDGRTLDEPTITGLFEATFSRLCLADVRPIGGAAKAAALRQVLNYHRENQHELDRVIETEVDVSLDKGEYILGGKIDLLLGRDNKLELLDFKTSARPKSFKQGDLASYQRQLCTYAHILERRYQKPVDRLYLYWTAEPRRYDALMQLPYDKTQVEEAGADFDRLVRRIKQRDFRITSRPDGTICKECDLRPYCRKQGTIRA